MTQSFHQQQLLPHVGTFKHSLKKCRTSYIAHRPGCAFYGDPISQGRKAPVRKPKHLASELGMTPDGTPLIRWADWQAME